MFDNKTKNAVGFDCGGADSRLIVANETTQQSRATTRRGLTGLLRQLFVFGCKCRTNIRHEQIFCYFFSFKVGQPSLSHSIIRFMRMA